MNPAPAIGIGYASLAGKTKRVALRVAELLDLPAGAVISLRTATLDQLAAHDTWCFCIPTYGMGDLDHHTKRFLALCTATTFSAIRVYAIVLGDQQYHGKTFAGALARFQHEIVQHGGRLTGAWPATGYTFEASPSVDAHGNFPGLVLDEVNQPEQTETRIVRWLQANGLLSGASS